MFGSSAQSSTASSGNGGGQAAPQQGQQQATQGGGQQYQPPAQGQPGQQQGGQQGQPQPLTQEHLQSYFQQQMHPLQQQFMEQMQGLQAQNQQQQGFIEAIRRAVNPQQEESAPNPFEVENARLQQSLDEILSAAIQAERAGQRVPMTVKIAAEAYQGLIQKNNQLREQAERLAKIEGQIGKLSHPGYHADQTAYGNLEGHIRASLGVIYGNDPNLNPVKDAQFNAVARLVGQEIQRLKQTEPAMWERISQNPSDQKRMANHFLKQIVPPKAMELMEQDHIRQTPVTFQMLSQAWEESKQIQDPATRAQIQEQLKPQLLEHMVFRQRAQAQQAPTLSIGSLLG